MSSSTSRCTTSIHGVTAVRRGAVAAASALVIVALTLTAGPAQAERPDLDGRVATQAGWDGEQNMAQRHEQMTVAWRLGLGG